MEIARIKQILRANVDSLHGKALELNNVPYASLKEFGDAILKKENNGLVWSIEVCVGNHSLSYGTEKSIMHCLTRNFNTIKVYASKVCENVFIPASEKAILEFGTNA